MMRRIIVLMLSVCPILALDARQVPAPDPIRLPGPELNLTLTAPIATSDEAIPLGYGLMERGGMASTPGSAVGGCACSTEGDSAALRLLWRPRSVRFD
jgi:hypothetical protein